MATNKPTVVTNWRELSAALNLASQLCTGGFCEPVGTVMVHKAGAGIVKMALEIDLIPSREPTQQENTPNIEDDDIPF